VHIESTPNEGTARTPKVNAASNSLQTFNEATHITSLVTTANAMCGKQGFRLAL
jgi:hypothetical protein